MIGRGLNNDFMSKAEGFVVLDAESEASIGGKICLFAEFLYSRFS